MQDKTYYAIGTMSGSSLDGLDIAYCAITDSNGNYSYKIIHAETAEYSTIWQQRLRDVHTQQAEIYVQTHVYYGAYTAQLINSFIQRYKITQVDFIASHGHTIFHNPTRNYTAQIGCGATISAHTGIPTISDFRSVDIALGGQGAPLAPTADSILFSQYQYFLNLGGICNITIHNEHSFVGFDICACNQVLNYLSNKKNMPYDADGHCARQGTYQDELNQYLNQWSYLSKKPPKSLDRADINAFIIPIIERYDCSIEDKLHTYAVHIAEQIARYVNASVSDYGNLNMLVTGGGAMNSFLMEKIKEQCRINVLVPDSVTVKFKEALLMCLLGVLRMQGKPNALKQATGAEYSNVGGAVYYGKGKQ